MARWIIPARAGFTVQAYSGNMSFMDHPRSRGVYGRSCITYGYNEGSSPLARGLLYSITVNLAGCGIIPARAGFTIRSQYNGLSEKDHPRSRGVYSRYAEYAVNNEGSSPLARGLRIRRINGIFFVRIIPARAGFTSQATAASNSAADHPRSRGVYGRYSPWGFRAGGSSPLARGLLSVNCHINHTTGIIPARAGFTTDALVNRIGT